MYIYNYRREKKGSASLCSNSLGSWQYGLWYRFLVQETHCILKQSVSFHITRVSLHFIIWQVTLWMLFTKAEEVIESLPCSLYLVSFCFLLLGMWQNWYFILHVIIDNDRENITWCFGVYYKQIKWMMTISVKLFYFYIILFSLENILCVLWKRLRSTENKL